MDEPIQRKDAQRERDQERLVGTPRKGGNGDHPKDITKEHEMNQGNQERVKCSKPMEARIFFKQEHSLCYQRCQRRG